LNLVSEANLAQRLPNLEVQSQARNGKASRLHGPFERTAVNSGDASASETVGEGDSLNLTLRAERNAR